MKDGENVRSNTAPNRLVLEGKKAKVGEPPS